MVWRYVVNSKGGHGTPIFTAEFGSLKKEALKMKNEALKMKEEALKTKEEALETKKAALKTKKEALYMKKDARKTRSTGGVAPTVWFFWGFSPEKLYTFSASTIFESFSKSPRN